MAHPTRGLQDAPAWLLDRVAQLAKTDDRYGVEMVVVGGGGPGGAGSKPGGWRRWRTPLFPRSPPLPPLPHPQLPWLPFDTSLTLLPPYCRRSLAATCRALREGSRGWFPELTVILKPGATDAARLAEWLLNHQSAPACLPACLPSHSCMMAASPGGLPYCGSGLKGRVRHGSAAPRTPQGLCSRCTKQLAACLLHLLHRCCCCCCC